MTSLAVFLKTLSRTTAIFLGLAAAVLFPPGDWSARRAVPMTVTAQKSPSTATLTQQLSAPDPAVRARAACELREFGDEARSALQGLLALLDDASPVDISACGKRWGRWNGDHQQTTPGEQAAAALVAIGGPAVQPLIAALERPSWVTRRNAAWALGALDDRQAVAPLVKRLRDPEALVREQAAWALGALDDISAVPAIIEALRDVDPRVRQQAAWAAGALDDSRATDGLLHALKDADPRVREQAAWALGAIGDERALHPLLPSLRDTDPRVRRQAAWAIGVLSR